MQVLQVTNKSTGFVLWASHPKLQLIMSHNATSVTAAAAVGKYSQIPQNVHCPPVLSCATTASSSSDLKLFLAH